MSLSSLEAASIPQNTSFNNKEMQHDFDQLYFFNHRFIFVLLDITGKAPLFAFPLMPCLLWLLYWGMCRVSEFGAMSKIKSYKIWLDRKKVRAANHYVFPVIITFFPQDYGITFFLHKLFFENFNRVYNACVWCVYVMCCDWVYKIVYCACTSSTMFIARASRPDYS